LAAAGLPEADAARCAELMTEADPYRRPTATAYSGCRNMSGVSRPADSTSAEYHREEIGAGDGAGRRRQRHGSSGDVARRE